MAIVAVCGDAATTTTVALATGWPPGDDVVVFEADAAGGDLAAWFDMPVEPSLSHVVTHVRDGAWPEIERLSRVSPVGLRVVTGSARATEARHAVAESARTVVPTLAGLRSPVVIADVGTLALAHQAHPFVDAAAAIVITHRQATQSARAAAVRAQRLVDDVATLSGRVGSNAAIIVAVIGTAPFSLDEFAVFVSDAAAQGGVPDPIFVGLAVDPLAAAVFGGRAGVSARRLARLPLTRTARVAAATIATEVADRSGTLWRSGR